MTNSSLKLNLGCGINKKQGYVNIDIDPKIQPDLVHDLTKKLPFADSSVSEIILQDVLEHLTKENGQKLIHECGRVLTDNSKITIRIPNISAILKKFKYQDDLIMLYLYGDTSQNKIHGAHKYGYTPQLIKEACQKAGILVDKVKKIDTNLLIEGCSARSLLVLRRAQDKLQGETLMNSNPLLLALGTVPPLLQKKEVIWKLNKNYPLLISKLILRPLSRYVSSISCTKNSQKFVKEILHYSHLRTRILKNSL